MGQLWVDGGGTPSVRAYFSYKYFENKKIMLAMNTFFLDNLPPQFIPINCKTVDSNGNETNNIAEYCALYYGLNKVYRTFGKTKLTIYHDSELVVNQVLGIYKCKQKHLQFWLNEIKTIWWDSIHYQWISRNEIIKVLGH